MVWEIVKAIVGGEKTDGNRQPLRLSADQIMPLATGMGGCTASDMIMRQGQKVAFMFRQAPNNSVDNGWRFMSGLLSPEHMDDPANHSVYDVDFPALKRARTAAKFWISN